MRAEHKKHMVGNSGFIVPKGREGGEVVGYPWRNSLGER